MTLHPRLTRAALGLVKRFETFQPCAEPTPAGGWSIGYGHTASARPGARVSREEAEALLIYDLDRAARTVERALFAPVTQRQFEALTALCFNLGETAFLRSSALARTNAGAELDAADEIERWRQAELGAGLQVVDALVRRRAAEKAHFLGVPDTEGKWPSALNRPLAEPGGEIADPPIQPEPPAASAALIAANGVQARLRRLIPDTVTDAPPPDRLADDETVPLAASAGRVAKTAPSPAASSLKALSETRWEPIPPPFDLHGVAGAQPLRSGLPPVTPDADRSGPLAAESPAETSPPTAMHVQQRASRFPRAFVGVVGLLLFAGAAAMILTGRPSLLDLALGAAGVVLAAAGLYGALGPPPRPSGSGGS